ncbi:hypothetical protein [Methanothermococcus sp.]|uniref:hypothetical protein n=1 Tax=Methanothermococcus sp. TaxID=2614238 RepID=UPI0025EAE841|nr:hypothetical protein [Methanothermococcus sp.]
MKRFYIFFLLLISISYVHADVEKIANYNLVVDVDNGGGYAHVKNAFIIKNLVNYPLVPGIGELRLQEKGPKKILGIPIPGTKDVKSIDIKNLKGYYKIGNGELKPMKVYVINNTNFTTICYEIWEPMDKNSNVTVVLEYDANIVDNGVFFKTLTIPVGCDMDIDNLNVKFNSKYHLTYQKPDKSEFSVPKNTLLMINTEFSILPLPKLPTHGYILLWLVILATLVSIFISIEIKRMGKEKENGNNKK